MMAVLVAQQAINAVATCGVRARKAVPSGKTWDSISLGVAKKPEDAINVFAGHRKRLHRAGIHPAEFGYQLEIREDFTW